MLKTILLAGVLMVTSNFLPVTSALAPTVIDTNIAMASQGTTLASVKPSTATANAYSTSYDPDAGDTLQPAEIEFIARINQERVSRGLNALSVDPILVTTARGHSREMCDKDYFDHHSPTSGIQTPMDRYLTTLHSNGYSTPGYVLVGENIYYCSESNDTYNVEYGHRALMNSPGHRANILEPRFEKVGVGVYRDAQGQFWVTEMFLKN